MEYAIISVICGMFVIGTSLLIVSHFSSEQSSNFQSFSYFLTKTYVVGTKKTRLNETAFSSSQNTCLK